jgi:hypothetical protein
MSERFQRTATSIREKMLQRYGDSSHHKHDKCHITYRQHCRSHPVTQRSLNPIVEEDLHASTGLVREFKLRKLRKCPSRNRIH